MVNGFTIENDFTKVLPISYLLKSFLDKRWIFIK